MNSLIGAFKNLKIQEFQSGKWKFGVEGSLSASLSKDRYIVLFLKSHIYNIFLSFNHN